MFESVSSVDKVLFAIYTAHLYARGKVYLDQATSLMFSFSLVTYMNSVFWRIGVPPPFHLVKRKDNHFVLWLS